MQVSSVGFTFNTLGEVLKEAQKSAEPTHNHPEEISLHLYYILRILL